MQKDVALPWLQGKEGLGCMLGQHRTSHLEQDRCQESVGLREVGGRLDSEP